MKRCISVNLTIIVALIILTLLTLPVIGCGIPSYPYLYPPEALGGGRVGFSHDENNDPDAFRGYEIFYRFYANDPDTAGAGDMEDYFTAEGAIRSVINGTSSSALTYGFRRLIIEGNKATDPPPQLPIDFADRNNTFTIELIEDETNDVIRFTYDSVTYNVFRYVPYEESVEYDYKPFLPATDGDLYDFTSGENDIHDAEEVDETSIYVAFFAVPYGFDVDALQELYANGSYEGMEYIGRFKIQ
ncbi:MAG: hypothetical protein U5P10_06715 [Spirochaetia bacterium]|nr:hypothetical protein [Spirochaetia bacterium]